MLNVARQHGPAVVNPTGLMAAHAADQMRVKNAAELEGKRYGLQRHMFDTNMGLAKKEMRTNKRLGNVSTAISALGLGADLYNANKMSKEHEIEMAQRQEFQDLMMEMIKNRKKGIGGTAQPSSMPGATDTGVSWEPQY